MSMKRKEQRMNLQPLAIDTGENGVLVTIVLVLAVIALLIFILRR